MLAKGNGGLPNKLSLKASEPSPTRLRHLRQLGTIERSPKRRRLMQALVFVGSITQVRGFAPASAQPEAAGLFTRIS